MGFEHLPSTKITTALFCLLRWSFDFWGPLPCAASIPEAQIQGLSYTDSVILHLGNLEEMNPKVMHPCFPQLHD